MKAQGKIQPRWIALGFALGMAGFWIGVRLAEEVLR